MDTDTYRNEGPLWPCGCLAGSSGCDCDEHGDANASPYSWAARIYTAALGVEEWRYDRDDSGYQAVDLLLGEMLASHAATLGGLLRLPPDAERSDGDIADAIAALVAERDQLRRTVARFQPAALGSGDSVRVWVSDRWHDGLVKTHGNADGPLVVIVEDVAPTRPWCACGHGIAIHPDNGECVDTSCRCHRFTDDADDGTR